MGSARTRSNMSAGSMGATFAFIVRSEIAAQTPLTQSKNSWQHSPLQGGRPSRQPQVRLKLRGGRDTCAPGQQTDEPQQGVLSQHSPQTPSSGQNVRPGEQPQVPCWQARPPSQSKLLQHC